MFLTAGLAIALRACPVSSPSTSSRSEPSRGHSPVRLCAPCWLSSSRLSTSSCHTRGFTGRAVEGSGLRLRDLDAGEKMVWGSSAAISRSGLRASPAWSSTPSTTWCGASSTIVATRRGQHPGTTGAHSSPVKTDDDEGARSDNSCYRAGGSPRTAPRVLGSAVVGVLFEGLPVGAARVQIVPVLRGGRGGAGVVVWRLAGPRGAAQARVSSRWPAARPRRSPRWRARACLRRSALSWRTPWRSSSRSSCLRVVVFVIADRRLPARGSSRLRRATQPGSPGGARGASIWRA